MVLFEFHKGIRKAEVVETNNNPDYPHYEVHFYWDGKLSHKWSQCCSLCSSFDRLNYAVFKAKEYVYEY